MRPLVLFDFLTLFDINFYDGMVKVGLIGKSWSPWNR